MATDVVMPQMGESIVEGTIVRWIKKVGEKVDQDEPLETAVRRELREEIALDVEAWEQLHTFDGPGRDPRGWTVSVVFAAFVDPGSVQPKGQDDAAEVAWHPLDELPPLVSQLDQFLNLLRAHKGVYFGGSTRAPIWAAC